MLSNVLRVFLDLIKFGCCLERKINDDKTQQPSNNINYCLRLYKHLFARRNNNNEVIKTTQQYRS